MSAYRYFYSSSKKNDDDGDELNNLKYSGSTKQCTTYIDQQLDKNNKTILRLQY